MLFFLALLGQHGHASLPNLHRSLGYKNVLELGYVGQATPLKPMGDVCYFNKLEEPLLAVQYQWFYYKPFI